MATARFGAGILGSLRKSLKFAAATLLALCVHQPMASAQQATGANWVTAGGTVQGTRYSGLDQITPKNVGSLVEEFSYPTGTKGSHQGSPLVVGSIMYVVTPFPNKLIALNLKHPGTALWTFDPRP